MPVHSFARRVAVSALCVALAVQAVGCSAFQPKTQSVAISTLPEGGDIKINGEPKGRAPLSVELPRNKNHTIVATLGSRSAVRELRSGFSTTGILDVVGTAVFLIPGIGLFTPGAWELDSTNVVMQLPQ